MTTYVTTLSRSLTSFSYMIGTIIQKLSLRTSISYYSHCGKDRNYYPWERSIGCSYSHCGKDRNYYPLERSIGRSYSHCGKDRNYYSLERPIGHGYGSHCGKD